jgi:alkylation response protein AidB-like acyl-CoA dehydrogenase
VDFALSEPQEMMRTLAREFLASEYPEKVMRTLAKDENGFPPELWQKMAATNLLGLSIPEEYGGVGDFLDLTVVLEEMGKVCFTGPFFASVVLGAGALMAAGSEEQKNRYLPQMVEGKSVVTLAVAEIAGKYTADTIKLKAERRGNKYVLNGAKLFVPDADAAGHVVCAARTGAGITLFIVDINTSGMNVALMKTVSGGRWCEVVFDDVKVPAENMLGEIGKGWYCIEKVLERANVALCAGMVGLAGQVLKFTLDYAKERKAFGHPIGAFQSVQHRCADMLMDIDGAKLITYQAAWRINAGLAAARESAIAKAWVSRACRRVMASAHQVHGAIGFSQDHVLHFYTEKAWASEFSFGGVNEQLEKLV